MFNLQLTLLMVNSPAISACKLGTAVLVVLIWDFDLLCRTDGCSECSGPAASVSPPGTGARSWHSDGLCMQDRLVTCQPWGAARGTYCRRGADRYSVQGSPELSCRWHRWDPGALGCRTGPHRDPCCLMLRRGSDSHSLWEQHKERIPTSNWDPQTFFKLQVHNKPKQRYKRAYKKFHKPSFASHTEI